MSRSILHVPYRQLTNTEKKKYWHINAWAFFAVFFIVLFLGLIYLSSSAKADGEFIMCPDNREGVATEHTSCAFAENVRKAFYIQGMPREFIAYSPVTGQAYAMDCGGIIPAHFNDGQTLKAIRCYGGDDAEVVIW